MEAVSYIYKDDTYTLTPILNSNYIDEDYLTVREEVYDTPENVYKDNMLKAVSQGLAFSVYKNTKRIGFVYNYIEDYKYLGACIWLKNDYIGSLVALKTIFDITDAHKLSFTPHYNGIMYFKSMITGSDIRAFYSGQPYVSIIKSNVVAKGEKIFKYLGII